MTAYVRTEREQTVTARKEGVVNLPRPLPAAPAKPPTLASSPALPAEQQPFPEMDRTVTGPGDISDARHEMVKAALEKMGKKDYAGAVGLFKEAAANNRSILAAIGFCYFNMGDYDEAILYLTSAVEVDTKDFTTMKLLAFSYYRTDDLKKSMGTAEAALALRRDDDLEALLSRLKKETRILDGYNAESSAHFTIYYDGYAHGKIERKVIGMLEDAYRTIGRELNFYPTKVITVILYGNEDFFDISQTPSWTGGYYDGKIRIPIRGVEKRAGSLRKVLFHEYTHAVVRSITRRCPLWINEGLAEHFSAAYSTKIGQVIPLRSLEKSFSDLTAGSIQTAYMESYSAVSYLVEKYGISRMKDLFAALSRGDDINRAFGETYGVTYDEFVQQWN